MTESPSLNALETACNKKREEMYGPNWQTLDWYGRPILTIDVRDIEHLPNYSLETVCRFAGAA